VSPAAKNATPRLAKTPGRSRDADFASAPVPATDLETAKRELRALLERPQQQTQYPPPQLTVALRRFGAECLEAIPILLERTDTPDFETRKWALYGLWDMFINLSAVPGSPAPETQAQALSLVRPRLSAILRSPTEPVELRRLAAQTLVPSWALPQFSTASGKKFITPPRPLDEGTLADMVAVLQSRDKASEGIRFELIQPLLSHQFQSFPEEARTIRDALAPLIEQGNPQQQLFAAYALAAIPGERPPGLKEIFVRALDMRGKTDVSYTYRAADALGMLGPEAKDAVPALLRFADATKNWGTSGYQEHALEAACRIQPELRPQYPDIDAKLKQEEAAQRPRTAVPAAPKKFANLGVALADPEMGTNVLRMLVEQVKTAADPIQKRQELLTELLTLWGNAPDPQREAIQQAITALRAMPDREEGEKPPALSLRALLSDGRVLLLDHKTTNELALHDLFNEWDAWYREHPADSSMTRERFSELSQAIKKVDADFQEAWLKQVLKSYPNLDRVVRGERP